MNETIENILKITEIEYIKEKPGSYLIGNEDGFGVTVRILNYDGQIVLQVGEVFENVDEHLLALKMSCLKTFSDF